MVHPSDVLTLEERRQHAMLAGDVPALQALLADGLVYVHSSGSSDSKASYLTKLASGKLTYQTLSFSDLKVQSLQKAAVVSGRMTAVVIMQGQAKNVDSLFMTVWACGTDGVWRMHAYQGSPRPTT